MSMTFTGYAAIFDTRDRGRDIIRPGAFTRTLAERSMPGKPLLPLYWQHNPEQRIGWIAQEREDETGLHVVASIDDPLGGAANALTSGRVTGLSFGYRACSFTRDDGGRELHEIDLLEVSLVTHPMQVGARVLTNFTGEIAA